MAQRKRAADLNFEESLQKLEAIVKRLEEEEIPLESSLKLFAEGQTLARACEEQLKAADNQIRQLLEKNSGEIEEAEFSDDTGAAEEEASSPEPADRGRESSSLPPAPTIPRAGAAEKKVERTLDDLPF